MVTIANIKTPIAKTTNNPPDYDLKGLSTDAKPTNNIAINSLFFEMDTGNFYYFNGTSWGKVGG